MSFIERWDMVERLLREAEEALRTPPRDAANGHARVQGAQAEVARLRQQHQGAVEALREVVRIGTVVPAEQPRGAVEVHCDACGDPTGSLHDTDAGQQVCPDCYTLTLKVERDAARKQLREAVEIDRAARAVVKAWLAGPPLGKGALGLALHRLNDALGGTAAR
jgi:Zn finger protein HypA/HybF involved in hydrogenase expression